MLFAFDLDKTLLKGNSSVAFCRYLYRKKVIGKKAVFFAVLYYIKHLYFGLTLRELHQKSFDRILKGLSLDLLKGLVNSFLDENLEKLLYIPAISHLQKAQKEGKAVVILSAAPAFLVEEIADRLGVIKWEGSKYHVDKDRLLCMIAFVVEGRDKAFFLLEEKKRLGLSKQEVVAYSDSHLDLPFLYVAGSVFVVQPDKRLKQVARRLGWKKL